MISNPRNPKSIPKTPLAAYQKQVTDIIGSRWYGLVDNKREMIAVGSVRLSFRILANGRVTNLKILSNTSNQTFVQICVSAVLESKFPSLPDSLRRELGHDFLDWPDLNFTMYPD